MVEWHVVGLCVLTVDHAEQGLGVVSEAASQVDGLGLALTDLARIRGAMVLSTCNRVCVVVETASGPDELDEAGLRACLAECGATVLAESARLFSGDDAVWRLFRVASGLESMVVGEREVAGQMRRALTEARREQTATYLIGHVVEEALKTSRQVASRTSLASEGRTVVAVGLDLVAERMEVQGARVLVMGTGSYAGATCAQLASRGVGEVSVHSASGRAAGFARRHRVREVDDLDRALAEADLVVTCRGSGVPALPRETLERAVAARDGRTLLVLDLAVSGDLEEPVPGGVDVIDLETIRDAVPASAEAERLAAEQIIVDGVHRLALDLERRRMAPAVVALRDVIADLVDAEIERLPEEGSVPVEDVAVALRRLAASMAHIPSARARMASEQGLGDRWLNSLSDVLGIDVEIAAPIIDLSGFSDADHMTCPVTGVRVADLGGHADDPARHDEEDS